MATSVSLGITHGLECPEFHEFQKYFDICWQRIPTHQVEAGTFPTPLIARLIALQNWHEGDNQCRGGLKVAGQRDLTRRRSIQIPYDSVECRSALRQSHVAGFQAALSELYRINRYPLYAYVRRRGYAPEEAQDLTQGFFLHLLEHKTLGRADPLRGKFRSFLLGSLQNYLLARRSGLARPEARRRSGVCLS
jgi:hypothetical protein